MTQQTIQILILGGGYSGVMAALRVAHRTRRLNTAITLVNASATFVERCRLHEQAAGLALPQRPLAAMVQGTKVTIRQGWVSLLDPDRQLVRLRTEGGEEQLPYDYLINALGSRVNRTAIPGVADHAFTLDPDGALSTNALRQRLTSFAQRPFRLLVVGGGATGIEAATQFKAAYPHSAVTIVTQGPVGAFKGPKVQQHLLAALREQQIAIHEQARVIRVEANGVLLDAGKIEADVIAWAGGFVASPLAREAGVQVNGQNQVLVDPYLRSLSHPTLYAVGDAAAPVEAPGVPFRMSLMAALVSGAQAAENVAAAIKGEEPQPLSFVWYGQGIALGPNDAVGFGTYPADAAWPLILRRRVAVTIRNFFVWYLVAALALERRFPGSFYWNGKGRYAQQKQRQRKQARSPMQA